MKGVVLAGGTGSRLLPLTKVCNKHLLPVYNKPMIYYPISTLVKSGVTEIMIVCGGNQAGEFVNLLGNGEELGVTNLQYAYQKHAGGIADALSLTKTFVGDDCVCVILGDNIFQDTFKDIFSYFDMYNYHGCPGQLFITKSNNPQWYGVVETFGPSIQSIEEKPNNPKSNMIATGLYLYNNIVFDIIKNLKPSARGELEITDINKYLAFSCKPPLEYNVLNGQWIDCGESIDIYLKACNMVKELGI